MAQSTTIRRRKRDVLASLGQPKVAVMLALGFSSGLPFLLSGNTLGYWLREEGTTLQAIGFLSWVGLAYSLKFLWAPIIDRVDAPIFGRFGRRRGWMLISQLLVALALFGLSAYGPSHGLAAVGVLAVIMAFSSSTQDIVVDAWRIEAAVDSDELGLLSAAYQLGYRGALLITEALILIAANHLGWPVSYAMMAVLMGVGLSASVAAIEPKRVTSGSEGVIALSLASPRGFLDAVIGPFSEFFRVYGWRALLMLAMISVYQLPNFVMGPMLGPYYTDIGVSKDAVGAIRASIGLPMTLAGIAAGGFSAVRFGFFRTLILGALLMGGSIAAIAVLAYSRTDLRVFGLVMAGDSFGIAFAGVALVTYMSTLTTRGYTATQYALLSSAYTYVGKFTKGFSGVMVEWLAGGRTLFEGYALFFVGAGLLCVPAVVLCLVLERVARDEIAVDAPASDATRKRHLA
jgi:MFS transporter, PAT family, beta-lactamase induction signal transducer AmpG